MRQAVNWDLAGSFWVVEDADPYEKYRKGLVGAAISRQCTRRFARRADAIRPYGPDLLSFRQIPICQSNASLSFSSRYWRV